MHKRKIKRQFKNFRIYKELYEKPLKHDWVGRVVFLIQILLFFAGGCNCCFWDIWLKIFRSPNFNNYAHSACASKHFPKHTVFVFTKSWSGDQLRNQLMQKAYSNVQKCWDHCHQIYSCSKVFYFKDDIQWLKVIRKTTIDNVHLPTLCSRTLIDVTLLSLPLVYCAGMKNK